MSLNILQNVNMAVQQAVSLLQHVLEEISLKYEVEQIYLALAILVVTTILIWIVVRSRRSGDTILLLGLTDAGKTLLYSLLVAKKFVATQTSIKENKGRYTPASRKSGWNLVDLPGHERVRNKYLYKHKDSARGVLFLIDSVKFPKEIRDVAELMYDILANRTMQRNKCSILVACNKQDQATAKSCNVIRTQLEKELTNLRVTRSAALLGVDDHESSKNAFIGKPGKDFEFKHVRPITVEFCECSLRGEEEDVHEIEQLQQWVDQL